MSWPPAVADDYRRRGVWTGERISAAIRRTADRAPDRVAVVCADRRITYRELFDRVDRIAVGLDARGLRAGMRCVVQLPNVAEFVEVCLASFELGVSPVLALPAHRRAELTAFCRATAATAYVTGPLPGVDTPRLVRDVADTTRSLDLVIGVGPTDDAATSLARVRSVDLAALREGPKLPLDPWTRVEGSSVALFQLSGGSTGTPKLIARTHDDYLYSLRQSVEVCRFGPQTVYLAALPAAHNFPLSSPGVLGTLLAGGRVVLCTDPSPSTVFSWVEREGVTVTAAVPPLLSTWIEAAAARPAPPMAGLQMVQVGGSRLAPSLARRIPEVLGCPLQQVYGMAEGLVCYTRDDDPPRDVFETQGRPMSPEDELRVVDPEGRPVPTGDVGELQTRGPYTIRNYFDAPEHDAVAFTPDGFYRTGDLVRLTATGHVIVCGRVKDQIQRGGEKIAAPEVERHLCEYPPVRAAAVVAVPDPYLGERAWAFVVADAPLTLGEIRRHFRTLGLAEHKVPDRLTLLDSLPTTGVGKVDKVRLRTLATTSPR